MSTSSTSSTPTTAGTGRLAPEQRSGGVYGSARPPTQRTDSPAPGAGLSATGEPTRDLVLLSLAELRTVRRTALRDEGDLSYVRRILQGRLDILRAEAATRRAERTAAAGSDSASGSVQAGSPRPAGATGAGEGTVSGSGSGLALGFGAGLTGAGRRLVVGAPVVARLSQILADAPTRHRASARHVTVSVPQGEESRRLAAEMLSEVELSDLSALTGQELFNVSARR
ncbi:ABC transporter permease [Streptomyces albidoflavus]